MFFGIQMVKSSVFEVTDFSRSNLKKKNNTQIMTLNITSCKHSQ